MPELPEVETVARDLRPRLVGATIVGARCSWARTLRTQDPEAFAADVAGRTVVEAVGRRAKLVVVDLSGDAALTIHLKMTGQLFVVPASAPEDPYVRLVLELADGRELRFRDIRKFGKVGLYPRDPATGELVTEPGGAAVFAGHGPEPLDPAFTLRAFRARLRGRQGRLKPLLLDQAFIAGVGNIYADEALWTARLHPLRSAGRLRPADERRLYEAIRSILAEAVERRGSSIDDYTAPDGDGAMQERLNVYQRAGEPCPRCGRPIRRIVIGARATHFCSWCQRLSAADRRARARILATIDRRTDAGRRGRRWTELAGEGTVGLTPAEAARRRQTGSDRADEAGRGRPPSGGPGGDGGGDAAGAGRDPMSLLRFERVAREIGTFVILDEVNAAIALGDRIGLVGPNGAGKTTLLRLGGGSRRARPRHGRPEARPEPRSARPGVALRRGVHGGARPPDAPSGPGAAHLDAMAAELAELERAHRVTEPAYADLQHRYEVLGGYTLDQRVDATLSGLGFGRDEWTEAADRAVGRRADAGGAGPPRRRRPRAAHARRADEPPRPRRARVARGAPPAPARLAHRRQPRPGVPRRDRDPDLGAARPAPDGVPGRLQPVPPPARRARRPARQGRRDPGRGDRPRAGARPALSEPPQVRQDARARGAPRAAPGRADRDAQGRPRELKLGDDGAGRRRRRPARARSSCGPRTSSIGYLPAPSGRADARAASTVEPRWSLSADPVPGRPAR